MDFFLIIHELKDKKYSILKTLPHKIYEEYLYFFNRLAYRNRSYLNKIYFSHDELKMHFSDRYEESIKLLIDLGLIERIETTSVFKHKLYMFKKKSIKLGNSYTIKSKLLLKRINKFYYERTKEYDPVILQMVDNLREVDINITEKLWDSLADKCYYTKHNRSINLNEYKLIHKNKYKELESFIKYRYSNYIYSFITVDRFSERFHSPFTRMSKIFRKYITIDGEQLVGIDLKQSQVVILSKVIEDINKNDFSDLINKGIYLYDYLQTELEFNTKSEAKEYFFKMVFSGGKTKEGKKFKEIFPHAFEILKYLQSFDMEIPKAYLKEDYKRYKNISWLLQTDEREIFYHIWSNFGERKYNILYYP